jgi:hypothetical protein
MGRREMTLRYYDLKKSWPKRRHIGHPDVQQILVKDFNKFTYGRWRQEFLPGMVPTEFESCDWQYGHKGRRPAFWNYTKHAACHWLVNFCLRLAQLVEPDREWRIITSQKHSTVWDGAYLLFDFNFQALGVSPKDCFDAANEEHLNPGEYMEVDWAEHYSVDAARRRDQTK